jgi:catechol 2,3-dioxygenase-like lactoylglutathione lyase family enzyme
MLFTGIDHPAIACRDSQQQIDWYCRMLGMRIVAHNGQSPPTAMVGYADDVRSETMIELMPARDPGADPASFARFQPGLRHLALRVSDFRQAYSDLQSQGIEFLMEPGQAVGGGPIVSFRDPEGNELQIVER